jgi:hypothetical protein
MSQEFFVTVEVDQTSYVNVESQKVAEVTAVGIQGVPGIAGSIESIPNVDAAGAEDGSVLVLDATEQKWKATKILEKQTMNGGFF